MGLLMTFKVTLYYRKNLRRYNFNMILAQKILWKSVYKAYNAFNINLFLSYEIVE